MKKFKKLYATLFFVAIVGMAVCVYAHPEEMSFANFICYFYMAVMFVFFRMGVDNVVEHNFFGISAYLGIYAVEACIMLGIGFWLRPALAVVPPFLYFVIRSYIYAKPMSMEDLIKNAMSLMLLNYAICVIVKVLIPLIF